MVLWLSMLALAGDCELRDGTYLVTVEPGSDVQTLFGHTALLVYDEQQGGYSSIYEWGRFAQEPLASMAWKVLTMTKAYDLVARPLDDTVQRYDLAGRGMMAQRLALSSEEQAALVSSVVEELNAGEPFTYNWYQPNCTTQVRDHLDTLLDGALREQLQGVGTSPAQEVLRHSAPHGPLWLGLQWGSGRYARSGVSRYDAAFLPAGLAAEVGRATVRGAPLVASTCTLGAHPYPGVPEASPSRSGLLGLLGGLWALGLALGRRLGPRGSGLLVMATGGVLGAWGSAAMLVGWLGTFAPFWGNHNLLLASPWSLLLVVAGGWHALRSGSAGPARLAGLCGASALAGVAWSLLGLGADGNLGLMLLTVPPVMAAGWALRSRETPSTASIDA